MAMHLSLGIFSFNETISAIYSNCFLMLTKKRSHFILFYLQTASLISPFSRQHLLPKETAVMCLSFPYNMETDWFDTFWVCFWKSCKGKVHSSVPYFRSKRGQLKINSSWRRRKVLPIMGDRERDVQANTISAVDNRHRKCCGDDDGDDGHWIVIKGVVACTF